MIFRVSGMAEVSFCICCDMLDKMATEAVQAAYLVRIVIGDELGARGSTSETTSLETLHGQF